MRMPIFQIYLYQLKCHAKNELIKRMTIICHIKILCEVYSQKGFGIFLYFLEIIVYK